MAAPSGAWRSAEKRRETISKLREAMDSCVPCPPSNLSDPVEVEKSIFMKSKSQEEYSSALQKVIFTLSRNRPEAHMPSQQVAPVMQPSMQTAGPGVPHPNHTMAGMARPSPQAGYGGYPHQQPGMGGHVMHQPRYSGFRIHNIGPAHIAQAHNPPQPGYQPTMGVGPGAVMGHDPFYVYQPPMQAISYSMQGANTAMPPHYMAANQCPGLPSMPGQGMMPTMVRQTPMVQGHVPPYGNPMAQPHPLGAMGTPMRQTTMFPSSSAFLDGESVQSVTAVPNPALPSTIRPNASPVSSSPVLLTPEENTQYMHIHNDLQKYIPQLTKMLNKLKNQLGDEKRNSQYMRIKNLRSLLQDSNRRVPLLTLRKCRGVLETIFPQLGAVKDLNITTPTSLSSTLPIASIPTTEPVIPHHPRDSTKILQDALKEGFVKLRIIKLLLVGPAGSGKTCLKYLLLGLPPPLTRISTPCAEKPIRAVSWTRLGMTLKGWREVTQEEFLAMVADAIHVVCEDIPAKSGTQEELLPVLQTLESVDSSSTEVTPPAFSEHATHNTLQRVLDRIECGCKSKQLMEDGWIHFVDSGGQPAFQELLPIFSLNTSVIACVHRLLERLDEHPTIEYYKDGSPVGEPHDSPLTNEEILQSMVQAIQTQPGNPPSVIIIGTHRDLEHKCSETRQEKNEKLYKLLGPHLREQLIFRSDLKELIFGFDTKNPEEEDRKTAVDFQNAVEAVVVDPVEVPIWWYIFESILQDLAKNKGRRVLFKRECFEIGYRLDFNEESIVAALEFLHKLNIIYYQPEILPSVIFSDSQVPLDKITELVEESYRLRGRTIMAASQAKQTRAIPGTWIKFRDQGIITVQFLETFRSHYIPGLFTPQHLLKLLEGLLIAAPIDGIEYFMPCLLDTLSPRELEPYRQTFQGVTPLLVHFPGCCPQKGVFCCLIVYLLNHCKWKLILPSGDLIRMSRNCVKFRYSSAPFYITLINTFTHFEVHVKAPPSISKQACPAIRDGIFQGISAAHKNLHYDMSEVHTAFFCPHKSQYIKSTTSASVGPHMATLDDREQYWVCSKDVDMMDELTPAQNMWFSKSASTAMQSSTLKSQSTLQSTPELSHLLEKVATKIPAKWKRVGLMLGLQPAILCQIEAENPTLDCIDCYTAVFNTWLRRNVVGCTWEAVIKALVSATVDEMSLAIKIKNELSS